MYSDRYICSDGLSNGFCGLQCAAVATVVGCLHLDVIPHDLHGLPLRQASSIVPWSMAYFHCYDPLLLSLVFRRSAVVPLHHLREDRYHPQTAGHIAAVLHQVDWGHGSVNANKVLCMIFSRNILNGTWVTKQKNNTHPCHNSYTLVQNKSQARNISIKYHCSDCPIIEHLMT